MQIILRGSVTVVCLRRYYVNITHPISTRRDADVISLKITTYAGRGTRF